MNSFTRITTLGGMFVSLGISIPLLFHGLGLGALLLPMFWPIAVCGFYLAPGAAVLVGIFTPVLSSLLTGMPPPPILYKMILELALLGWIVSLTRNRYAAGYFVPLLIGLTAALLGGLAGAVLLAPILGLPAAFYSLANLLSSLPGVALMLIALPLLLRKLHTAVPAPERGGNV